MVSLLLYYYYGVRASPSQDSNTLYVSKWYENFLPVSSTVLFGKTKTINNRKYVTIPALISKALDR